MADQKLNHPSNWSPYLMDLLSPRLVGVIGARILIIASPALCPLSYSAIPSLNSWLCKNSPNLENSSVRILLLYDMLECTLSESGCLDIKGDSVYSITHMHITPIICLYYTCTYIRHRHVSLVAWVTGPVNIIYMYLYLVIPVNIIHTVHCIVVKQVTEPIN